MPYSDESDKNRWERQKNSKTLDTAKKHRDHWTQRDLERIMDDDTFSPGGQTKLCKELGRTWAAIKDMRWFIKAELEKELDEVDYDGPIIFCPPSAEQDAIQAERESAALRNVCIKLTSISMRTTEHEVGSEDHQYELMELYAMLGLME